MDSVLLLVPVICGADPTVPRATRRQVERISREFVPQAIRSFDDCGSLWGRIHLGAARSGNRAEDAQGESVAAGGSAELAGRGAAGAARAAPDVVPGRGRPPGPRRAAPARSGAAPARSPTASTRSAAAPGREDTTRVMRGPVEQQPDAVVGRPAAGQLAAPHGGEPHRQPLRLAVGVDASTSRAAGPSPSITSGGPLDRVTPPSNQHIAPALRPASTIPRSHASTQQLVEPVRAPDREQVAHRAAADVDHVLLQHDVARASARVPWRRNSDRCARPTRGARSARRRR